MTLNTSIYVLDEVDPHEAFHELRRLLGATDEHTYTDKQDTRWEAGERYTVRDDPWTIANHAAQGLPAWLFVHYRPDAPLRTQADQDAHDEDCNIPANKYYEEEEDDCDGGHEYRSACWIQVNLDTAYGYRGPNGTTCTDLHTDLILAFGEWLGDRNVRWKWMNEYTGEVFEGTDGLREFSGHGAQADEWYRTQVLPSIAAMLEEETR